MSKILDPQEEVEALNEVSEEAGSFTRASSEVLAARRIVKSKRCCNIMVALCRLRCGTEHLCLHRMHQAA